VVQTPEEELVAMFRRTGAHAARGTVTVVEFINRVFDAFASLDRVYPEVIPALWELVPVVIREEFVAALRGATAPEFRYHAFHFGGGRPLTEDELRRDADLRTARVRAWAVEFVRFLDGLEPEPTTQLDAVAAMTTPDHEQPDTKPRLAARCGHPPNDRLRPTPANRRENARSRKPGGYTPDPEGHAQCAVRTTTVRWSRSRALAPRRSVNDNEQVSRAIGSR
jgi:hypothetical protein